eukprot:gene2506-biopygen10936
MQASPGLAARKAEVCPAGTKGTGPRRLCPRRMAGGALERRCHSWRRSGTTMPQLGAMQYAWRCAECNALQLVPRRRAVRRRRAAAKFRERAAIHASPGGSGGEPSRAAGPHSPPAPRARFGAQPSAASSAGSLHRRRRPAPAPATRGGVTAA